ncbi:hypothetical protein ACHAPO_002690 [Fusarium lateritium]
MQDFPTETGEMLSIGSCGRRKQEAGVGEDLTQADEGGPEADHLAGCSLSREAGNKPVAINQDELMMEQMQSWPYQRDWQAGSKFYQKALTDLANAGTTRCITMIARGVGSNMTREIANSALEPLLIWFHIKHI